MNFAYGGAIDPYAQQQQYPQQPQPQKTQNQKTNEPPSSLSSPSSPSKPKAKAPLADNPSQGLIPLPTTDLFLRRLNGWARTVSKIVRFLETVADQERRLAESLARQASEIDADAHDSPAVFRSDESVMALLLDISAAHAKAARDRSAAAALIDSQLLPVLKDLFLEIRRKIADTDKVWGPVDREMKSDLDAYVRLAAAVRNSLMRQQWRDDAGPPHPDLLKDAPRDPWLANLALRKHIAHCAKRQDYYRSKLSQQHDDFSAFEKVVVQNIRATFSTFYEWRSSNLSRQLDQVRETKSRLDTMSADNDWVIFKSENCDRFIDDGVPLIQPSDLTYDGFDDASVKCVRQGQLFKKEGVFKRSYRLIYVILSVSGYLHAFPPANSDNDLADTPELTLDLAECSLSPLLSNEKEPEEIAITEKSSGLFGRETKHKFKGKSMAESADWWGIIHELMREMGKRNAAAAAAANAAAAPRSSFSSSTSPSPPQPHPQHLPGSTAAASPTASGTTPSVSSIDAGSGNAGYSNHRKSSFQPTTTAASISAAAVASVDESGARLSKRLQAVAVASVDESGARQSKRLQAVAVHASTAGSPSSSITSHNSKMTTNAGTHLGTTPSSGVAIPPLAPPNNRSKKALGSGQGLTKKDNLLDNSLEDLPQLASVMPPSPRSSVVSQFATFPPPPASSTPLSKPGTVSTTSTSFPTTVGGTGSNAISGFASFPIPSESTSQSQPYPPDPTSTAPVSVDNNVGNNGFGLGVEATKVPLSVQMEMALQSAASKQRRDVDHVAAADVSGDGDGHVPAGSGASVSNPWATYESEPGGW